MVKDIVFVGYGRKTMKIVIDIPKEFEENYKHDRFSESLVRIKIDIKYNNQVTKASGRYEYETLEMLEKAFQESRPLIQCKDCEHFTDEYKYFGSRCTLLGMPTHSNGFCFHAERRKDDGKDGNSDTH